MKTCFDIRGKMIVTAASDNGVVSVFSAPNEGETSEILETLGIDDYDLDSALDPDEISRVEFAPDHVSMIWKQPRPVSIEEEIRFEVSSVGLFLRQANLTMIIGQGSIPFPSKDYQGVDSSVDVLLKYLFNTIRHYLGHLKAIKQITVDLESKIGASMENRYLLHMFALSESLIYYLNAIEANGAVLLKLAARAERLGFTKHQVDFLDDITLENRQCARQAQIYSTVLSGLMDARGTIINNNMNVLLKNLTVINVVFLPLNLIAGIGGMSEFTMMTGGFDWKLPYLLVFLAFGVIGWLTWVLLVRYINKGQKTRIRRGASANGAAVPKSRIFGLL
jgi:magnesium transporter